MKLHQLSIPYRIGARAGQFGWALVLGLAVGSGGVPARFWPFIVAGAVVLALAGVAYEYAYYQYFEYELTTDTLDIDSGVFARREREVPYRRIQNVDVTQTVVQRVLGIATVKLETAGGGSTEAVLECVAQTEAQRLQREIRRLKGAATGADDEPTMSATTVLYELDDRSLVAYSLLSFNPQLLSGLGVLFPILGPMMAGLGFAFGRLSTASILGLLLVGVAIIVLGAGIWLVSAGIRFVRFYGFRLHRDGDDLRYERGLLKRYTGTIPLEKVQSLSIQENVFMRRVGYATLVVETAGYTPGDAPSGGSEAAVPFAPRGDVMALAQTLEPFEPPTLERPPVRARRRYMIRYGVLAGLAVVVAYALDVFIGVPFWWFTLALGPIAILGGHYRWRQLGHEEQASHAVTRSGFWSRSTTIVPYYRLQTVVDSRSLFQRRWGLASVSYDTAGSRQLASSGAVAHDVEAATAEGLTAHAIDRLRATLQGGR